jgi:hypothetical protein
MISVRAWARARVRRPHTGSQGGPWIHSHKCGHFFFFDAATFPLRLHPAWDREIHPAALPGKPPAFPERPCVRVSAGHATALSWRVFFALYSGLPNVTQALRR